MRIRKESWGVAPGRRCFSPSPWRAGSSRNHRVPMWKADGIFFNFWVADAADLARSFILRLSEGRSYWPSGTQGPTTASEGSNDFDCMAETLDIQFLAGLTRTVGPLVYWDGAFTRYFDNPALKALLVPFTSAGLVNFVDLLTTK
jgi:hypothetical protein